MVTPFKENVNAGSVAALADALAGVRGLDGWHFRRVALDGLDALELKARIAHVATALDAALTRPFADSAPHVARAVAAAPLDMWQAWPAQTWVEDHGLESPEIALAAIGDMTARASGESAVRPYIDRHPELAWRALHEWAGSPEVDRRRLASEGTRPRLPWARSVPALVRDPAPGIALLDRLREDPEEYVRRSVANHLNDIGRDHPEVALTTAERWRAEGGENVDRVLRHGLRGLVKKGHPRALALLGVDHGAGVDVGRLELASDRVAVGDDLEFAVTLRAQEAGRFAVDFAITYRNARGQARAPKVFKGGVRALAAGEEWRFERRHPMRHVSIRRIHPGTHRVDLQVNGTVRAGADFDVTQGSDP